MPSPPPNVTGISPKEGPPGTRVIIRGENFGSGPNDLVGLTICGVDCLLSADWQSSGKIVARSGTVKGRGDVIVTTRYGGKGTCMVQFKSYFEAIGPLKESAVWIDESQSVTSSWGRKRTTVPSPLHQDNPLGLSDEANEKKCAEDELHEAFPEGSGCLIAENFVPAWFLLENHSSTTFDDLKAGLTCLRRKVNTQKEGQLSFLKANVGAVLDQLDTLNTLRDKIQLDKEKSSPMSMIENIERAISDSRNEADALFHDVLGRKERADATRNALGVLQRFKFLFYFPCNIKKNVQKGDYDVVINDYTRVKSLFANTEVQIFQKVYQEIEKRIGTLRETLAVRLKEPKLTLPEQKKIIRYLLNLEVSSDPAWSCIEHRHSFVMQTLGNCKDKFLSQFQYSGSVQVSQGEQRRAGNKNIRRQLWKDDSAMQVIFTENLCRLLCDWLPDLWKLGQAYFSGELSVKEVGDNFVRVNESRHQRFKEMISESMILFANLIRSAILPSSLDYLKGHYRAAYGIWPFDDTQDVSEWLPHSIHHIRTCYVALIHLDFPAESLDVVQQLLLDLRVQCLRTEFAKATATVLALHHREDWLLEVEDDVGGTSRLPVLYENVVLETIQFVQETILRAGQREAEPFSYKSLEEEATSLWSGLVKAFATTSRKLLAEAMQSEAQTIPPSKATLASPETVGVHESASYICQDQKLLVIMSNCHYVKEHTFPRLMDTFTKNGYPNVNRVHSDAVNNLEDLDREIFEAYVELKCDPIVGVVEQSMYAGRFDWAKCPHVKGVRAYVKEILLNMITVNAEVSAVNPKFVTRVLVKIADAVTEEIARLFSCVTAYSKHGILQAQLDLLALKESLNMYTSNSSSANLKEALEGVPPLSSIDDKRLLADGLSRFNTGMRVLLICFSGERKS